MRARSKGPAAWAVVVLVVLAALAALAGAALPKGEEKSPYYVGAKVCGSCHQGKAMGDPFGLWLNSKHARAHAVLAKPEAKEIVKLSGITQEPQAAPICLGCHATAAEAEKWQKDPTFFIGDGVQCEKCHGPGSEYMNAKVMMDRAAAMKAGLKIPSPQDCMSCHNVKGSHVAVHKLPQPNMEDAWKTIAHAQPPGGGFQPKPAENRQAAQIKGPKFAGVEACAACHDKPSMGYQFSRWRMSAHARAFGVLATPAAYAMAEKEGLAEEPQKSPACLKCHATAFNLAPGAALTTYSPAEGIGCEHCHGPGSEYMNEAIMLDKAAAAAAGLKTATKSTCLECHEQAHGKSFDLDKAWSMTAHPSQAHAAAPEPVYKTPIRMAFRPDGKELFVACEASGSVAVVDPAGRRKIAEIPVGGQATDIAFSSDGRFAYVTSRLNDSVAVIDVAGRKVIRTFPVGDEPHGLRTDRSGKILYVLNAAADSISVLDTASGKEIRRLAASRSPWSAAVSPDAHRMLVTNVLSRFVDFRQPALSEITLLDADGMSVVDRFVVPQANYIQGIAWHPSGAYAFFTLSRTKNVVPMSRVVRGWTITNGLGIVWAGGRVDQVLLDEPNLYFPDPTDVAFAPDGRKALVTSSGLDCVAVIDVPVLIGILQSASQEEREHVLPNHLGKATEFVIKHIPTGNSPRGVVISQNGRLAFSANSLDDSLTVIDMERMEAAGRIDLGGPREISHVRYGERLFHSARITFQRQFSCHSCHPDGHVNGLTFDIEPDGIGISPVDNRTLRGILDTAPFKWEGTNPSLAHECGPRLAVFFTRIQPFTPVELSALVTYISHISRPPNRYRPLGVELTPAQRRGRDIFYRTHKNTGEEIPVENRCSTCHSGPMFTDRRVHNVGTLMQYDRTGLFETPHLNNIYDSAPYLHNGITPTLEEIWTRYNPYDRHGVTNDMTKDQLNDLIEFLKTL
jgi:YVTN family beta-propeller protein